MIGLISCFLIGRHFFRLATENNKNRWTVAILAALATFIIQLFFEIVVAVLFSRSLQSFGPNGTQFITSLAGMGIGALIMAWIYREYKTAWEKKKNKKVTDHLLDR